VTVRRSSLCIALGLSLLGCEVAPPGRPTGSSVQVLVRDPQALASGQALRAAVVWISAHPEDAGEGPPGALQSEVTADQAFAIDRPGNAAPITLPLDMPSSGAQARLVPRERLALIVRDEIQPADVVPIHRPRIIAYADRDADGRLDLTGSDDLVLAADGGDSASVAAVLELEDTLAALSLEASDAFYRGTAGRYTPFLRVEPLARPADGRGMFVVASSPGPVRLVLGRSPVAGADVRCGRAHSAFLDPDLQVWLPTSSDERIVFVDDAIELPDSCASAGSICTAVELAAIDPPEIRARPDHYGSLRAYCRAWDGLEALWLLQSEVACAGCECGIRRATRAYVVQSGAPPPWWPCGSALPFCDTDAPVLEPADC
jgi:hypothetical protein